MLDNNCRHSFMNSLSWRNKYETSIVLDEDFERFTWAAEHVAFPKHWALLLGIHGINPNHDKDKHRIEYKKRQVFFRLLSLIWMSNTKLLTWWAMIQSVANFWWGVGSTASDINSYWGNTVSSSNRNRRLAGLVNNFVFHYHSLLCKLYAKIFCYGNFQIG